MTEYQYTTNSRVFKRLHNLKNFDDWGMTPHRGDNDRRKHYGSQGLKRSIRYPSWKLASKNRKQWMPKTTLRKVKDYDHDFELYWNFSKRDMNGFTFVFFRDLRGPVTQWFRVPP